MKNFVCSMALAAVAVLVVPSVSWAQPAPQNPQTPAGADAGASQEVEATVRTENGRRVYVASTTIEVRGEIQRPYVFSVSGRSNLGYTYFEAPVHFVREIVDAVRRAPF